MDEFVWVLVVWFGWGTGFNSWDAGRGGPVVVQESRYEAREECEKAAAAVMRANKHMKAFRAESAECMAVPKVRSAKGKGPQEHAGP